LPILGPLGTTYKSGELFKPTNPNPSGSFSLRFLGVVSGRNRRERIYVCGVIASVAWLCWKLFFLLPIVIGMKDKLAGGGEGGQERMVKVPPPSENRFYSLS
jgi:hypothetical protein